MRAARESLVGLVELGGQEYLNYRPIQVDVALIRGTEVDPLGNIGCAEEPAVLDVLAVAQAARASGGTVLAQVKRVSPAPLPPHQVTVPGPLVDAVVVVPDQWQTYAAEYDPTLCGPGDDAPPVPDLKDPLRTVIARRAALEVPAGAVLNVGFGVAAQVVDVLAEQRRLDEVTLAIEQGLFNGIPESGALFGVAHGPTARMPSTSQFELFAMGLLDVCCLGMAQVDAAGSVNVSRFGAQIVGPGGFIDISQHARRAVFCGTFTTKGQRASQVGGLRFESAAGSLLGEVGAGFRYMTGVLAKGRLGIAGLSLGISRAALTVATGHAETRVAFGRPIGTNQAVAFPLADAFVEYRAGLLLAEDAARLVDAGDPTAATACSMAKLYASEACVRHASTAVQVFGGAGYIEGGVAERLYRDARITMVYEGTSEIQRLIISRAIVDTRPPRRSRTNGG